MEENRSGESEITGYKELRIIECISDYDSNYTI